MSHNLEKNVMKTSSHKSIQYTACHLALRPQPRSLCKHPYSHIMCITRLVSESILEPLKAKPQP